MFITPQEWLLCWKHACVVSFHLHFQPQDWTDAAAIKTSKPQAGKWELTRIFWACRCGKASTAFCGDVLMQLWWFLTSIQNATAWGSCSGFGALRKDAWPAAPLLCWYHGFYSRGIIPSRCAWWDNEIQTLLGISWISTSFKDEDGNEETGWCDR